MALRPGSLAASCEKAILVLCRYFAAGLAVEDKEDHVERVFYRIWRPCSLFLAILVVYFVFHIGSVVVTRTTLLAIEEGLVDIKSRFGPKPEDVVTDLDERAGLDIVEQQSESSSRRPSVAPMLRLHASGDPPYWRCAVISSVYHVLLLAALLTVDYLLHLETVSSRVSAFMVVSVALSPIHMAWTHITLIRPSYSLMQVLSYARTACSMNNLEMLILPSLARAGTQALVVLWPVMHISWNMWSNLRLLLTTFAIIGCLFIPATIVLNRIEAALLPSSEVSTAPIRTSAILWPGEDAFLRDDAFLAWAVVFVKAIRTLDLATVRKTLYQYGTWAFAMFCATAIQSV